MKHDFTGPKGIVVLTQNGKSLRGSWQGNGEVLASISGNINGNNVQLCLLIPEERTCVSLTINFNNMTMNGIERIGKTKWILTKRR